MRVSVQPLLGREGHFVEVAAVVAAFTRLDEHGRPPEALAVWADKGHGRGARAARRAAPPVRAHAAVVWSVETDARASPVGQADGLCGLLGRGALFPSLWLEDKSKSMHVTLSVMIEISVSLWLQ